jgi:hypothetical protein
MGPHRPHPKELGSQPHPVPPSKLALKTILDPILPLLPPTHLTNIR